MVPREGSRLSTPAAAGLLAVAYEQRRMAGVMEQRGCTLRRPSLEDLRACPC